jgi:plasmid stability protein
MAKLIVELPEELHQQLKRSAAAEHRTMKTTVTVLLQQYLHGIRQEPVRKATGFCGAWAGRESAETLLAEVKAARRWRLG